MTEIITGKYGSVQRVTTGRFDRRVLVKNNLMSRGKKSRMVSNSLLIPCNIPATYSSLLFYNGHRFEGSLVRSLVYISGMFGVERCKNTLVCMLLSYRLIVIQLERCNERYGLYGSARRRRRNSGGDGWTSSADGTALTLFHLTTSSMVLHGAVPPDEIQGSSMVLFYPTTKFRVFRFHLVMMMSMALFLLSTKSVLPGAVLPNVEVPGSSRGPGILDVASSSGGTASWRTAGHHHLAVPTPSTVTTSTRRE